MDGSLSSQIRVTPGREKWEDDSLIGGAAVVISSEMTDEELITEAAVMIRGLTVSMTERAAASILILTWHMRAGDERYERLFPKDYPGVGPNDVKVDTLEEPEAIYETQTERTLLGSITNKKEVIRAGAFLAASTLKLFTKASSSWPLAWDNKHFIKWYRDFNHKVFPFGGLKPNPDSIEALADLFQKNRLLLGTLGRILYATAESADQRQFEMLFVQHLAFTGMHIIPQFINAQIGLGGKTSDLIRALRTSQSERTLLQLADLINDSLSKPISMDNRGTWRFARLFDQSSYLLLQSKLQYVF